MPTAEQCVTSVQLRLHARERPDALFGLFEDGTRWTYADALGHARRAAAGLHALGVGKGDMVAMWLPAGPDAIRLWLGASWLGAILVPINLAYRGNILAHVLATSGARLIAVDGERWERLAEVDRAQLTDAVVFGDGGRDLPGLTRHPPSVLLRDEAVEAALVEPWDTQMVIYTSGTTGPSKGVLISGVQSHEGSRAAWPQLTADDRFLANLPLFHVSGMGAVRSALSVGGSFALVSGFTTATFWDVVRETGSTMVILMGVMATFLMKQPPSPGDRDHPLKAVMMVPLAEDGRAFAERFGVTVYTVFNMTETSSPITGGINPSPPGTCGRLRAGVEGRLVDANDCEVSPGGVGELILRTDLPWAMNSGYLNDPAATARAWRNGWFHTGDSFRQDEAGNFFFVDRVKDSIRRRGENISSFEVENEVCAHPRVREAAAVAVASDLGEDDVLIAIALNGADAFDPADLIRFLAPRVPSFMVPRYVRVLGELPKTPTAKVEKHRLRAEGIATGTFDREAAGLTFKRDVFIDRG